jgi:hypothetical protein
MAVPLLSYVGWFTLMFLTPLAWLLVARQRQWDFGQKELMAAGALIPLSVVAVVLSLLLNQSIAALGVQ